MSYRLEHVCMTVSDLEKTLQFYCQNLGLKEVERKTFPENKFQIVYLSDSNEEFEIKLYHDYSNDKEGEPEKGFNYLTLTVENLKKSYIKHKKYGYKVSKLHGTNPLYYFLTDPDGNKIKIVRGD